MNTLTRRRWLLSTAVAALTPLRAIAAPPVPETRIATAKLPITSRSISLYDARETRTVVTAIAADPRGELLAAAGDDHSIRVLRAATLKTETTLSGHRDLIRSMAFDPNGNRLVSAGNDGRLIVWDREDSFKIQKQFSDGPALARVRFAPGEWKSPRSDSKTEST